jgi:amino acid transporter
VLVAFVACGISAQALTARTMFSVARDGVLPASGPAAQRRSPPVAVGATS